MKANTMYTQKTNNLLIYHPANDTDFDRIYTYTVI
jgi:hypothetical protein